MQIFRQLGDVPTGFGPSVVIIGNFDGVHAGHQWVMRNAVDTARRLGARAIAVTLEPHPARILHPDLAPKLITLLEEKLALIEKTDLDAVLVLPFNQDVSSWGAREFVCTVLCDTLNAVEVHEGENFRFGRNASANVDDLTIMGADLGFKVYTSRPLQIGGLNVSSSRIRELIQSGAVHRARRLLGRPFRLRSTPAHGRGYGTRYAVPTINLAPYAELLPGNGVYVTCLQIGTGDSAEFFEAVTNIGNRPTFGADSFAVESHLLNFHPLDLHEHTPLTVTFLKRLREEKRWPSPEALRAQIELDVSRAQHYFHHLRQFREPAI